LYVAGIILFALGFSDYSTVIMHVSRNYSTKEAAKHREGKGWTLGRD
jgi:hypothetical protein